MKTCVAYLRLTLGFAQICFAIVSVQAMVLPMDATEEQVVRPFGCAFVFSIQEITRAGGSLAPTLCQEGLCIF